MEKGFASILIEKVGEISISFELPVTKDFCRGKTRYFTGDTMLCEVLTGEGNFGKTYEVEGMKLHKIVDMIR